MKILIVGLGSMGKRRIRNLKRAGVTDIVGFDPREERRQEAEEKYGVKTVASFEEGLTTYNFGIAGFPQAMLRFLLEPGRFPRADAEEIDGVVIHRRTTAASGRRQPGAA